MKRCSWKTEHLEEYIAGQMNKERIAELEKHLKTCAECREQVKWLNSYQNALQGDKDLKAGSDFLVKVRQKIDERRSFKGFLNRTVQMIRNRVFIQATTGLAILAVVILVSKQDNISVPQKEMKHATPVQENLETSVQRAQIEQRKKSAPARPAIYNLVLVQNRLYDPEETDLYVSETADVSPMTASAPASEATGYSSPTRSASMAKRSMDAAAPAKMIIEEDLDCDNFSMDEAGLQPVKEEENLSWFDRVKGAVQDSGGKILPETTDKMISICIPAKKAEDLISRLKQLGFLKNEPSSFPKSGELNIKVDLE